MKDILVLSQYVKGLINEYKDHGNDYSMNDVIEELEKILCVLSDMAFRLEDCY